MRKAEGGEVLPNCPQLLGVTGKFALLARALFSIPDHSRLVKQLVPGS
jgi:hypothetical protein